MPTLNCRTNAFSPTNGISHARSRSNVEGLGIQLSLLSHEPSQDTVGDQESHERANTDEHEDNPDRKLRDEAISNRKVVFIKPYYVC